MSRYFEIRRLVVIATEWRPIVCPITCSRVTINNANVGLALRMRTNPLDPDTEMAIATGYQFIIASARVSMMPDDPIAFLSIDSDQGLAVLSFTL